MPYKNIVFVKLEKRLLNDSRWYMMSETSQLNFIKLILLAAESYNKIPSNLNAIKKALKTDQSVEELEASIKEIRHNFPKLRKSKRFYYFLEFDEKTNYISTGKHKLKLGKSLGEKKGALEEEKEKEKEKEKEEDEISPQVNPEDGIFSDRIFKKAKRVGIEKGVLERQNFAGCIEEDIAEALDHFASKVGKIRDTHKFEDERLFGGYCLKAKANRQTIKKGELGYL